MDFQIYPPLPLIWHIAMPEKISVEALNRIITVCLPTGGDRAEQFDQRINTLRDAIHTHFVTLIGKWTIVGGWVKRRADKRGKVAKSKYKSFNTSLERAD